MTLPDEERERIARYLDEAITNWRLIALAPNHPHNHMAMYYIDAYQSARMSILGQSLP